MPCNVLKEISSGRYQFDPGLKSTLTLTNTDGTLRKAIVVNGVIIAYHQFKQLTDLFVMTETASDKRKIYLDQPFEKQ